MAVEQGPVLAPAPRSDGLPVSGIACSPPKAPAFHVHTHLVIYVAGELRAVPGAIGMVDPRTKQTRTGPRFDSRQCYYDLHVHAQDGVIHVEGPVQRSYTLGQFFDEWGLPLSSGQVGPARGVVTAYVDGRPQTGSPRAIVLTQREVIQLDVGEVVAPKPVDWSHF